ncbi:MAG: ParB/RepB/Spo0J family partition protein [Bacteroidales bacterium]|nr:ParB/RepB/Spo0J family partition protein [Bacteroidales bacterium]
MANKKNKNTGGLGRGLGSILPDVEMDIAMVGKANLTTAIDAIPLDEIDANPFQPRKEFDDEALGELAQSIREQGVITPITVRCMPDGRYQLIAGERRLRASHLAGLQEIPAYIRIATDSQMMEMALVENIQRENLNAMEIAFSYKALVEECQLTHEQLSEKVGKDRSTITNYLRLLNLPSEAQVALSQDKISMAHARCLMGLSDTDDQLKALHKIMANRLSVHQAEVMIKALHKSEPVRKRAEPDLPTLHAAAQSSLRQHLQNEVEIKRSRRGKGTIIIHFDNDADFERITRLIDRKG